MLKTIEYINKDLLIISKNNPRIHSELQIQLIRDSIKNYGFLVPLVIDEKNRVLSGHGRLLAYDNEDIPCVRVDNLTEEQKNEFMIIDNKTYEIGSWDEDLLKTLEEESEQLESLLEAFNFDNDEGLIDRSNIDKTKIDDIPEQAPSVVKRGDIWLLGNHRIMCGDSTNADDVDKLMDGKKADMVFTDPPYGMKKENEGVLNDNLNFYDLLEFNKKWIPLTFEHMKDVGSWYCWGIDEPLMDIYCFIIKPMIKIQQATFRNLITWNKGNGQGQLSSEFRMYPIADEKCIFIMKGVQGLNNNSDNYFEKWEPIRLYLKEQAELVGLNNKKLKEICGVSSMYSHWFSKSQWELIPKHHYIKIQNHYKKDYEAFEKDYEELKKDYEELKKEYYSTRAYFDNTHDNMNNVWQFDRTPNSERELTGGHATPKPIKLCERAIITSSIENNIILDLFLGSGTTLIACENTNRICYGMEIDEHYCDVIIKRWEILTENKAIKVN